MSLILDNSATNDQSPDPSSSSTSGDGDVIISNSKPFNFSSIFYLYPRTCLIIFILILQCLFLSFYVDFPSFISSQLLQSPKPNPNSNPNQCEFGKFYVYDLPPALNSEFIKNCENLCPWAGSQCGPLSNNGLGRKATGISRVIPAQLAHTWYWTDQFSLEVIFHNRMLHHKCRTKEPESAVAFYIPFYPGLAVRKYLLGHRNFKQRDMHCDMMLDWIQTQKPYFNRSNGSDHFITFGRITWDFRRRIGAKWGSRCIFKARMSNITRLLIERDQRDSFEFGVPYPTGFHPMKDSDIVSWQDFVLSRERHALFCYVGAPRATIKKNFRGVLLSQCRDSGESCRSVDCSKGKCINGTSQILEAFLDSDFCLQPRGDSFTRRSVFDCMVAGSIPVFFWNQTAYEQYPWYLTSEPESYSVFLHHDEVLNGKSIKSVLERFSIEEVKKMREKVVEFIPRIVYAKPNKGLQRTRDAVDVAVDEVLKRIRSMNLHDNENLEI